MARRLNRLTEKTLAPFAGCGKIDREAGVIHDVLICGTVSENGRDYPPAVFRRDYAVYEGRPVNADHGKDATISRRLGWFEGVRPANDGRPRGSFHVLKSHPMFAQVMEAAERNPSLFGFSHVALCESKVVNGREVVEAIKRVESIDLVAEPATTQGFFEGKMTQITLKKLVEKLAPTALSVDKLLRFKRVIEDGGAGEQQMDEPAETDPDEMLWSGYKAAVGAILDQYKDGSLDAKEALKLIAKYVNSHAGLSDDGKADDAVGDGENKGPEKPKDGEEGKKPNGAAILEALDVADKVKFDRPGRDDLETIAAVPKDRREAVAKRLKTVAEAEIKRESGEKPKSASRDRLGKLDEEQVKKEAKEKGKDDAPRLIPAWDASAN